MPLSTLSCPPGGNLLTNNTIRTSTSGYPFVVNIKLIPCISTRFVYQRVKLYSALNTARPAISNLDVNAILDGNVKPVGQHRQYLRGIFNQEKPVPKYSTIWLVDKVLHYLKGLFPLEQLSMKDLALKLVMLIALTTGQRCQTLTLLNVSEGNMQKDKNCYNFTLTDHVKQDRPGKVFGNLHLYKYLTPELCIYTTLQKYLTITSTLRGSTKLLISYIRPFNAVTSSTIARWIKAVLLQAGIDILAFSAHSTRSAATSKAAASVPIDAILKTVGWSRECTFRKNSNKSVALTNQLSEGALSGVYI